MAAFAVRNSGGAGCPCPVLLCFFINHEHWPGEAGGRRVRQGTGYPGGGSCYFGPEVKSALVKGQISLVERLRWQGLPADG